MISGSFGDNGELFFEIQLVAASGMEFSIMVLGKHQSIAKF